MSAPSSLSRWQQLSIRLSAGVLAVLFLSLLGAGAWLSHQEELRFQEQNSAHAAKISSMVASSLSERMLAGGGAAVWKDVAALAEELRQATGTVRIQVMSRTGLVKAATEPTLAGHQYRQDADAECTACHGHTTEPAFPRTLALHDGNRSLLRVISSIPKLPACSRCHQNPEAFRGMIAIDFDHGPVEAASAQRNRLFATIALVAGVTMFGLILLLLRTLVTRPVTLLASVADRVGQGRLDARAPILRQDELGSLSQSFNLMASRIQKQVAELEVSNLELNLLYTLVVEVSRNMELTQVQSTTLNILRERLQLEDLAFCLETGEDSWCCATFNEQGEEVQLFGDGPMIQCILGETRECQDMMPGIPQEIVMEAMHQHQLTQISLQGEWVFVIPFVFTNRVVGLLAGRAREGNAHVADDQLLSNIAVHIGLALDNSRNYSQAITDGLTGFRNKRYGLTRLDEAIYKANRYHYPLGLAMLDIDHFKRVNDAHGHQAGDKVLREVARRLQNASRKSDLLVRYGGEEFMILFPYTGSEHLPAIGEKLRKAVADVPVIHGGQDERLDITISIGMVVLRPEQDNPESLIARADQALYRAKETGRNRVVLDLER